MLKGCSRGAQGVLKGCGMGARGVLKGYSMGLTLMGYSRGTRPHPSAPLLLGIGDAPADGLACRAASGPPTSAGLADGVVRAA